MTAPPSHPVRLAEDIASLLKNLNDQLAQATPRQAAEILGTVLTYDDGVLALVTDLIATGSRFAQGQAHRGSLPPEVWLAMGRCANELGHINAELDGHTDALKQLGARSTAGTTPTKPVPSAMIVRRSR
ncbi:hypothetical protein [Streptomyces sp. GbtcB6]|uniref:hypothetical protein n=1 Tax=Streptomyces sp. GbtcB6 TaxID=2824751 RepID=UPI001C304340|nr:hypothetical protein [Streptomyces sp. GbtcB6]